MDNDRIIALAEDLRNHVFEILDIEPELTGDDAGKVAKAVEEAFLKAMQEEEADDDLEEGDVRCSACGWVDQPDNGDCYECGAPLDGDRS